MEVKHKMFIAHIFFWLFTIVYEYFFFSGCMGVVMALPFYLNYFILVPYILRINKPLYTVLWFVAVMLLMVSMDIFLTLLIHYLHPDYKIGSMAVIVVTAVYASFYYIAISTGLRLFIYWQDNLQRQQELVLQQTNTEIRLVKSNINIPFILQTLSNIENMALKAPEDVQNPVVALSNVLRYGLYDSQAEEISLQKEIDILEDYFSLVNQNELHFSLHLQTEGELAGQIVPPNILVKFVANWKEYFSRQLSGEQYICIRSLPAEVQIDVPATLASAQFLQSVKEKFVLPKYSQFEINCISEPITTSLVIKHL